MRPAIAIHTRIVYIRGDGRRGGKSSWAVPSGYACASLLRRGTPRGHKRRGLSRSEAVSRSDTLPMSDVGPGCSEHVALFRSVRGQHGCPRLIGSDWVASRYLQVGICRHLRCSSLRMTPELSLISKSYIPARKQARTVGRSSARSDAPPLLFARGLVATTFAGRVLRATKLTERPQQGAGP